MKKELKIALIILGIFVLLALIFFTIYYSRVEKQVAKEHDWLIKEVVVNREDYYKVDNSLAILPKWEELTIVGKFPLVQYNGKKYMIKNTTIAEEMIGEKIGNVVLTGYDTYTKNTYTHNATCYMVKTFPEECIIAIKYEGTNEYYVSINAYYRPTTLGNFMEDLNLKEIVSFGTIYYDYWNTDKDGNKQYENIEFPNVNNDIIWQMLFDDVSAENVHRDGTFHSEIMSISVDIPLLGYKNISVSVSEDGYLTTNILETGKTFYIGEDKVKNFVNYIIKNYDGYKTVYVDENGNELPEENLEEETNQEDDTIIVHDIITNETSQYVTNSSGQNFTETYVPQN